MHKRRKKGGGGGVRGGRFVEMEAELSDEEGRGADVSEDEDEPDVEEDGMLVRAFKAGAGVRDGEGLKSRGERA